MKNLLHDLDIDETLSLLRDKSIKYIIYSKAEKYLLYDNRYLEGLRDYDTFLQGLPDITDFLNKNFSKLTDYIIYESDNYIIYELSYYPRVYGYNQKKILLDIKFNHILNGLYLINNSQLNNITKIILTDLFDKGYQIIGFNFFRDLIDLKKLQSNTSNSINFNNENHFLNFSNSENYIIIHKNLIYYIPSIFFSFITFIFIILSLIKWKKVTRFFILILISVFIGFLFILDFKKTIYLVSREMIIADKSFISRKTK